MMPHSHTQHTHECAHIHVRTRSSKQWSKKKQVLWNYSRVDWGEGRFVQCKHLFGLRRHFCFPNPCIKIPPNIYFSQQVFYLDENDLLKLRPSPEIQPKI